jgi:hypothetical protein
MDGAEAAPSAQAFQTFAPCLSCARSARHWSGSLLDSWRVNGVADDALLVVSELTSNAVEHGAGPVGLCLQRLPDGLRIEVTDEGGGEVVPRHPDPFVPGGRGLVVVSRLSRAWGVRRHLPGGKTVWAELVVDTAAGVATGTPPTADLA